MGIFVLRRLLQAVPVLVLASAAIFLMLRLIPGDPAMVILGSDAQAVAGASSAHAHGYPDAYPTAVTR